MNTILGLDLGTASVGWALINEEDNLGVNLLDLGVRIFEPPVEKVTEQPKNKKRRDRRSARRLLSRRRMRRETLVNALQKSSMLPDEKDDCTDILRNGDPYFLRYTGLDNELTLEQISRALFHICKRRGFKSNRKTDKKEDTGKVQPAISELQQDIDAKNCRTLGEYFYLHRKDKKRRQYTSRAMYEYEFQILWDAQSRYHQVMTPALKEKIKNIIFLQRPLKVQKNLVGLCQFEKRIVKDKNGNEMEVGKRRAPRSHPLVQKFRMLQDINHLTVDGDSLSLEKKKALAEEASKKATLTWKRVRKITGFSDNAIINLEEAKKKNLPGISTTYELMKAYGKGYDDLSANDQDELYTLLQTIHDDEDCFNKLKKRFRLNDNQARDLLDTRREPGYSSLSLRAIKRLLPFLEDGSTYADAVQKAGYLVREKSVMATLPSPPQIRNPAVTKTLHELRKVVNAIIRKYGMPGKIRIELARDMKYPKKIRDEMHKRNAGRAEERSGIEERLKTDFNISAPTKADVEKYRLWEECQRTCIYTNKAIPAQSLFNGDVEIEHIIPWSRSLDNSYMNKTLCYTSENRDKAKQTPWEFYGSDDAKWGRLLHSIKALPWPKQRKFMQKDVDQDNYTAPLNDTRYASVEARKYLESLGVKVQVGKGTISAMLRDIMGLNGLIAANPGTDKKNRGDHRHHAIDAVVIALTSPSVVKELTYAYLSNGRMRLSNAFDKYHSLREEVEKRLGTMLVSHRVSGKITGALHEETSYGSTGIKLKSGKVQYVYRKPVKELTPNEIKLIRDSKIRTLIEEHLKKKGCDLNNKKKINQELKETIYLANKKGAPVPIQSVRILRDISPSSIHAIKGENGEPYRHVQYGNNHHMEILRRRSDNRIEGRTVTMMEAAKRARMSKESIIRKDHGPEYEFLMSLAINEMLKIENGWGLRCYYVQKISNQITLRLHTSADRDDKSSSVVFHPTPSGLMKDNPVKISVSPLGEAFVL